MRMSPRRLRWLLKLWGPFAGAGIRVVAIGDDWRSVRVELRRRWYNQNYVGTHFGGSLFAMTDPFWMVMLLQHIGGDYVIWDKQGSIEFVAATREPVYAEFVLDDATIASLCRDADANGKTLRWFETEIRTASGELVARVRKEIYVRRKQPRAERAAA